MSDFTNATMKRLKRDYCSDITSTRFSNYGKRKINKKLFYDDMDGAYLAGVLALIEELHNENKRVEYQTVNELLGDLQLIMVDMFNSFRIKNLKHNSKKVTIENLVTTESK